jgi:DNA repair exonuclease SbcCD ATPase subunit
LEYFVIITFKVIRWKNFLSTGNAFTEMQLDRNTSTLIIGDNGSGKSTLLDAITFALFNKPFRNISKPQLINTINRKKMVVEVEFNIGSKKYLIRRGSQPSIFDIEIDGVLVDQNANIRDYQRHLEENILKLNYKSFTQIVILGSASFTPFMQLTPNIRREIIEDILDIRIFTTMKDALKVKMNELKDKLRTLEGELTVTKEKANLQKKYIDTLENDKQDRVDKIVNEISDIEATITSLLGQVAIDIEVKNEYGDIEANRKQLENFKMDFTRKIKEQKAALSFYADHDDCPTCKQGIPHEFKETITTEKETKISELEVANTELVVQWESLDKKYEEYLNLQQKIVDTNNTIMSTQTLLQRLVVEKSEVENKVGDIEKETLALKEVAKDLISKTNERTDIKEEQEYHTIAESLLKDSGIKTKIIRQYLPVINKLVNKYLKSMDFFVQFDLDETFKETIKSRHRDKFTYASFSEGEKQRIDLALVFTWRTIAKMKNSASTNLLLLDEVFDSSLDVNGTDYVMQLLNTIGDDTNVFVISHKSDQLFDKFRSVVKFEKKNNYSVMT